MAYMKDLTGRRLDSFQVAQRGYRSPMLSGMVPIAGRPNPMCLNVANLSNGIDTSGNYRYVHPILVSTTSIRLLYVNWYNGDTSGLNPILVKASIEWPEVSAIANSGQVGAKLPVTFDGARTVTIPAGGFILSDPIEVSFTAGQLIYTRTYVSVANAGEKWPVDLYTYSTDWEGNTRGAPATDLADSSSTTIGQTTAAGYGPTLIVGSPLPFHRPSCVGIVGDSIAYGSGDSKANGLGFIVRALLAASIPYVNTAVPGEQGVSRIYSGKLYPGKRVQLAAQCTHWIEEYGQNDRAQGQSLSQIQATRIVYWREGARRGISVFATTNTPHTTSTDAWATSGNQTVTASESIRTDLNTWLRDGAPLNPSTFAPAAVGASGVNVARAGSAGHPLAGVFDTAAKVEVNAAGVLTLNGGRWAAGRTGDGIHPSQSGHTEMSAGIDTSKLT